MGATAYEIRPGAYYDSVVLMQLQRGLLGLPGVLDAGAVMATPANLELLRQSDLLPQDVGPAPDDLIIVVRAEDQKKAAEALGGVDNLLKRRRAAGNGEYRPRSLESAAGMLPDAKWVLISVPGRYAAGVARQALDLGKHVFLYSDNVSLEDEIALKQTAQAEGLLVMGPDCGTAIINGVGLGFANRVRRGPIGLAGASGTGLQAVTARIHALGGGVSHAIGTGGRDLKGAVGAITMRQGIDLLGRDPQTQVIVLVSKPPDPEVAVSLLAAARATGKPVVVDFIGYAAPARRIGGLHFAASLSDAAQIAVSLIAQTQPTGGDGTRRVAAEGRRYLRGLFSGGTLAYEALQALEVLVSPLYSNIATDPAHKMADPLVSQAHTILDLGEDVFTVGRLHPMIDNDLRIRRLRQEAADPEVALILLDVVLGEGAHPDPASELAPAIAEAKIAHGVEVVAVLVGTDEDPQGIDSQRERLAEAGVRVFDDVIEAVAYCGEILGGAIPEATTPVALKTLIAPLAAINVGLESFYDSLTGQGVAAVHVEWKPPAGGDEKLAAILAKMKK